MGLREKLHAVGMQTEQAEIIANNVPELIIKNGKTVSFQNPNTKMQMFALNKSLTYLPDLNDVPVNISNITSVVTGPSLDANTAADYATMVAAYPKVYSFNQASSSITTASKYLIVPGGYLVNTYSQGVFAKAKAWPQNLEYYSNGLFETLIDAKSFVLVGYVNSGSDFSSAILIDGMAPTADQITILATTGNKERWITVTLKTRKTSLVTFDGIGNVIKEIRLQNQYDTISKPAQRQRMAIYGDSLGGRTFNSGSPDLVNAGSLVIGDKYTILTIGTSDFTSVGASVNTVGTVFTATGIGAGTGTTASIQFRLTDLVTVGSRVSRILGLPTPHQSCTGGTGFGTGATTDSYALRIAQEKGDSSVSICWIWGTGNDNEFSPQLPILMNQVFDTAKIKYPNAQIILTSCYDSFPSAGHTAAINAVYSAVVATRNDVILIPISTNHTGDDGMLTGTGSVQSTTGDGNADIYLGFSGGGGDRHWNAKGIKYGADYIARKIKEILTAS